MEIETKSVIPVAGGLVPGEAEFGSHIGLCGQCGRRDPKLLLVHRSIRTLRPDVSNFDSEIDLDVDDYRLSCDPVALLFFNGNAEERNRYLDAAIETNLILLGRVDPEWAGQTKAAVVGTRGFWASLQAADFRGEDVKYMERIVYALTQIACGRAITTSDHIMKGKSILHNGKSLPVWNAYVFKMGATDQDKRCSRIYYLKGDGQIILHNYEPDAHS